MPHTSAFAAEALAAATARRTESSVAVFFCLLPRGAELVGASAWRFNNGCCSSPLLLSSGEWWACMRRSLSSCLQMRTQGCSDRKDCTGRIIDVSSDCLLSQSLPGGQATQSGRSVLGVTTVGAWQLSCRVLCPTACKGQHRLNSTAPNGKFHELQHRDHVCQVSSSLPSIANAHWRPRLESSEA